MRKNWANDRPLQYVFGLLNNFFRSVVKFRICGRLNVLRINLISSVQFSHLRPWAHLVVAVDFGEAVEAAANLS